MMVEPKPGDLVAVLEFHFDAPQYRWISGEVVLVDAYRIGVRLMDGPDIGQCRMLERSTENREWKRRGA
ncbi:hypothetical protein QFZ99_006058 [Paraburkholderia atlantica]|uniref:hypothetical protein n=1 Tax=Paraburkholderia atlantica TaxID=2654982 RepID=UPI003D22717A